MKVMCIIKTRWNSFFYPHDHSGPSFGEICTATQCASCPDCYDIAEYPYNEAGRPQNFLKIGFTPVSDIDETEFVREYNKEFV